MLNVLDSLGISASLQLENTSTWITTVYSTKKYDDGLRLRIRSERVVDQRPGRGYRDQQPGLFQRRLAGRGGPVRQLLPAVDGRLQA